MKRKETRGKRNPGTKQDRKPQASSNAPKERGSDRDRPRKGRPEQAHGKTKGFDRSASPSSFEGKASRDSREAFVFTDRSGKKHSLSPSRDRFAGGKPAAQGSGRDRSFEEKRGASSDDRERSPRGRFGGSRGAQSGRGERADRNPSQTDSRDARPGRREERLDRSPRFEKMRPRDEKKNRSKGFGASKSPAPRDSRGDQGGSRSRGGKGRSHHGRGRREERYEKIADGDFKLKARIDKNRKGFAFLQFENKEFEDAFLNPFEAERFFHGDRVEASITEDGAIVEIVVLEHRFREVFGRYYKTGKTGMVVYERKKAREELLVQGDPKGAKTGEWVRGKVIYPEEAGGRIQCEIMECFGEELPPSADIQMVSAEYNLVEEHSREAVKEAESFVLDLDDPNRVDLRKVPFITIDGETARDFDDAVYVERTPGGGFLLWVAIADVSHYVRPGTALDDEALSRGTSVYFPERAFHMLPRALSENLCSLRPDGPRLTMTSKIEYDRSGNKLSVEVMNSIIQSHRRATYNEIQSEADAHSGNQDWEYRAHFDLYAILRRKKSERGCIDFDLPEAEVRVEPTGEPISIKNRPRLDAHRLIEEFMIAANESVTEWALERSWPFVYRVHDEPARQALVKFQELCAHHGIDFRLDEQNLAESLNAAVEAAQGHPAETLLNMALLRSMAQAHYSSVHGIHFGLASEAYTHFTSPIRRYPDLVVHRMLKLALEKEREKKGLDEEERAEIETKLAEITEHCSYRERLASDAERESIKLKQARIMVPEIGNEFDAKINGMMESGIFASLEDPFVEGFISQESMNDDFYSYDERKQLFIGRRTKKTMRVGDAIRIRVDRVDLDLRRVEFSLLTAEKTEKEEY
jgi:ribonuclease R